MTGPLSALPSVPDSALPRAVREGSPADKQSYKAALGFERMLLHQLAEQIAEAAQAASGGEDEQSAGMGAYQGMLADSLADAVTAGGGLGLARDLYSSLRPATGAAEEDSQ